jgi:2-amino-4-hydroxy-6-hydroxymethyldihydropteridine diphosphokinase
MKAIISLGANLGNPKENIDTAITLLREATDMDLLSMLHGIEKALGRERIQRWGPRTIDLDLIQYADLISKAEELTLPHPRAHERRFVLEPWFEIEPDAILLTHGKIKELLEHLPA